MGLGKKARIHFYRAADTTVALRIERMLLPMTATTFAEAFPLALAGVLTLAVLAILFIFLRMYRWCRPSLRIIDVDTVYKTYACTSLFREPVVAMRDDLFHCDMEAFVKITALNTSTVSSTRIERIRVYPKYPALWARGETVFAVESDVLRPGEVGTVEVRIRDCDQVQGTVANGVGNLDVPDAVRLKAVRLYHTQGRGRRHVHFDSYYHDREAIFEDLDVFFSEEDNDFMVASNFYEDVLPLRFLGYRGRHFVNMLWLNVLQRRVERFRALLRRKRT